MHNMEDAILIIAIWNVVIPLKDKSDELPVGLEVESDLNQL